MRKLALGLCGLLLIASCSSSKAQRPPARKPTPAPRVASTMKYDAPPPAPAMSQQPRGDDVAAYTWAVQAADKAHRGTWTVRLTDARGNPLPRVRVKVALKRSSFLFGTALAFNDTEYATLRKAGFNTADFPTNFTWTATEPAPGRFTGTAANFNSAIDRYLGDGETTIAHNLLWLPPPGYDYVPKVFQDLSFSQFLSAYHDHVVRLARSEGGRINVWDIVNEPMTNWANAMNLNEQQWEQVVKTGTEAVHEVVPSAKTMVNSYGVKYDGILHHNVHFMEPLQFYTDMQRDGIPYDIIGVELYYNNTWGQTSQPGRYSYENPQMSLAEMGSWLDRFAALRKSILITEFEANSEAYPGGSHNTYWGQAWSPTLQADYTQAAYTMFFARASVLGVNYWEHNDGLPVYKGGLLAPGDAPRPVLDRIAGLIHHWTTSGTGTSGSDGSLNLTGYAGVYQVQELAADGTVVHSAYVNLPEGTHGNVELKLPAT